MRIGTLKETFGAKNYRYDNQLVNNSTFMGDKNFSLDKKGTVNFDFYFNQSAFNVKFSQKYFTLKI